MPRSTFYFQCSTSICGTPKRISEIVTRICRHDATVVATPSLHEKGNRLIHEAKRCSMEPSSLKAVLSSDTCFMRRGRSKLPSLLSQGYALNERSNTFMLYWICSHVSASLFPVIDLQQSKSTASFQKSQRMNMAENMYRSGTLKSLILTEHLFCTLGPWMVGDSEKISKISP